jgi:glutathione S-transferase
MGLQRRGPGAREGYPQHRGRARKHANAAANVVPFAILGLVYVLAGAQATTASIVFGVFAIARIAHAFAYLGGKQPWRTISFAVGALSTLVLMGLIVRSLIVAA